MLSISVFYFPHGISVKLSYLFTKCKPKETQSELASHVCALIIIKSVVRKWQNQEFSVPLFSFNIYIEMDFEIVVQKMEIIAIAWNLKSDSQCHLLGKWCYLPCSITLPTNRHTHTQISLGVVSIHVHNVCVCVQYMYSHRSDGKIRATVFILTSQQVLARKPSQHKGIRAGVHCFKHTAVHTFYLFSVDIIFCFGMVLFCVRV